MLKTVGLIHYPCKEFFDQINKFTEWVSFYSEEPHQEQRLQTQHRIFYKQVSAHCAAVKALYVFPYDNCWSMWGTQRSVGSGRGMRHLKKFKYLIDS